MAAKLDTYPVLRLQRLGTIVVIQPLWDGEVAGPSLTCDLETGSLALADHPRVERDYAVVHGVLGMARLEAGPALVVITGAEEVATLRGHPVFKVTATQVLADSNNKHWKPRDHRYLGILRAGVDPEQYGRSVYFSYAGDITLTQQRYDAARADPQYAGRPAWQRAEPAFFWNRHLAQPLLDAGMSKFVPPCFMGFVEQLTGVEFPAPHRTYAATITLVARRSVRRIGTRQWRRGADQEANVANFVESEQLVEMDGGAVLASFVQVRGSIPVLWSQSPNLKYKIPIRIAAPGKADGAFAGHVRGLVEKYKECVAINLANQTGREGKLSSAYREAAERYSAAFSGFRLVPFDFHKQCGATNYGRLSILWQEIAGDFKRFGYYFRDNAGTLQRQNGVFRTNCIDTLDRTNVVQGMLGKRQLEHLLARLGLIQEGASLPQAYPQVDRLFRVMWADHGDEISSQYAGTGAMKSAFTRTGKRDVWGLLDDGNKSLTRYFLNNFRDGHKQDALDLVSGNYEIVPGRPPAFGLQPSPVLPLLAVLAALYVAWSNLRALVQAGELLGHPAVFLQQVVALVLLAALIVWAMFKKGQLLVDRPQLRPDLAHPWS